MPKMKKLEREDDLSKAIIWLISDRVTVTFTSPDSLLSTIPTTAVSFIPFSHLILLSTHHLEEWSITSHLLPKAISLFIPEVTLTYPTLCNSPFS